MAPPLRRLGTTPDAKTGRARNRWPISHPTDMRVPLAQEPISGSARQDDFASVTVW